MFFREKCKMMAAMKIAEKTLRKYYRYLAARTPTSYTEKDDNQNTTKEMRKLENGAGWEKKKTSRKWRASQIATDRIFSDKFSK